MWGCLKIRHDSLIFMVDHHNFRIRIAIYGSYLLLDYPSCVAGHRRNLDWNLVSDELVLKWWET